MLDRTRRSPELNQLGQEVHMAETAIHFGNVALNEVRQATQADTLVGPGVILTAYVEAASGIIDARAKRNASLAELEKAKIASAPNKTTWSVAY